MKITGLLPYTPFSSQFPNVVRNFTQSKVGQALINTPRVKIEDGKLLYLLISIYIHGETLFARTIIRGQKMKGLKSHEPLYRSVRHEMESLGLCTKALGGGMLDVNESSKKIKIFGKCKTFGRADHFRTRNILKATDKYRDYKISLRK